MPTGPWKDQRHTSIGIEPADLDITDIRSREEIEKFSRSGRATVILGGGSNSLLGEIGTECSVVKLGFFEVKIDRYSRIIRVGAGRSLDDVLRIAAESSLSGLETLAGIPGTLGGAVVQNAGAYGNEISFHIKEVECWDRLHKRWVLLAPAQCDFANRNSLFLRNRERYLIYQVVVSPQPQSSPENGLSGLTLIEHIIQKRNDKFPAPSRHPNSGSVLIHPQVSIDSIAYKRAIKMKIQCHQGRGSCKIPIGAVLEKLGFKGKDFGNGIALSDYHANFLVRYGEAKLTDWLAAVMQMRRAVADSLGVTPEVEPTVLGVCHKGHSEIRSCAPAPL